MTKKITLAILPLFFLPLFVNAQVTTSPTLAEVATHNTQNNCWIIVSGNVYSVTSYIPMHPGGSSAIVNTCGGDATTLFNNRGGTGSHSSFAQRTLGNYLVGPLTTQTPATTTVTTASTTTTVSTTTATSTILQNVTATTSPVTIFNTCKKNSIEKRDTTTISARETYNTAIKTALLARKEGEKAALTITDKTAKKVALKKVANDYKIATKNAQTELTKTRKNSWNSFEKDSKTCTSLKKEVSEKVLFEKKKENERVKEQKNDIKKNEDIKKEDKKIKKEENKQDNKEQKKNNENRKSDDND